MPDMPDLTGAYDRDTAATHMMASVPMAHIDTPVDDVIRQMRGQQFQSADVVFVIDAEGRLEGIVRLNDLLSADVMRIGEVMEPEHKAVGPEADQEEIAALAIRYDMISVPVVDGERRLIGAVPPEALFRILRDEHMEDLQRLAGITAHEEGPGAALNAPLWDRFRRRIPWLVAGLAASTVITMVMVGFEQTLAKHVSVAFFVPALVYVAGAIGTQAVSVSVRGLAQHDVDIGVLLRDEMVIGLMIGTTLGVMSAVAVWAVFGEVPLAMAVGLAVLGGGAVSAVVGFALPWAFQKMGSDPALGSGPICTIIQDAASISIYFLMVIWIVI